MRTDTHPQAISNLAKIAIGLGESAVVLVEAGPDRGYLIAAAFATGGLPSEVALSNVIYVCAGDAGFRVARIAEVLVSGNRGCWAAVDPASVSVIPCPSRQPYPILFISEHGFDWMAQTIDEREFSRLFDHLAERFAASEFVTDRSLLTDPKSPFFRASCIDAAFRTPGK